MRQSMIEKMQTDQVAKQKWQHGPPYPTDHKMSAGDELSSDCVVWALDQAAQNHKGWVLDGYPSNEQEMRLLKDRGVYVDKLIVVDVPDEDLIRLATGRRLDYETSTLYHCEAIAPNRAMPCEGRGADCLHS